MTEEKEELEGVFMALCDQRNDEQCLEVLRRWKAQIIEENPMAGLTDSDINNLLDVLNWLKYDDVEKTTNARLKLKVELSRREKKEVKI